MSKPPGRRVESPSDHRCGIEGSYPISDPATEVDEVLSGSYFSDCFLKVELSLKNTLTLLLSIFRVLSSSQFELASCDSFSDIEQQVLTEC